MNTKPVILTRYSENKLWLEWLESVGFSPISERDDDRAIWFKKFVIDRTGASKALTTPNGHRIFCLEFTDEKKYAWALLRWS